MQFQLDDTIAALASAAGPAGRGIIRISGPMAVASIEPVFRPHNVARWGAGSIRAAAAFWGTLRLPSLRAPVPVLVSVWPDGRSYTGQRLVEIHAPGSPPLLQAILAHVFEAGIRPATPGEFTVRAFLSGRIDLVQAEAVLAVIDSTDEHHLTRALVQLAGGISDRISGVRDSLVDLLADLEAGLDFVEEDIQFVSRDEVARRIADAQSAVEGLLEQCRTRTLSTGRRRVVIAGLPNAGKSTLFNELVRRDAALVSPVAGTTRDYLSAEADWDGLAVELIDTPGRDEPEDALMEQALELGRDQCEQADLIVWCSACNLDGDDGGRDARAIAELQRESREFLIARTKGDLRPLARGDRLTPAGNEVCLSVKRGEGLSDFVSACVRRLASRKSQAGELVGTTAARCRESLHHSRESLLQARISAESRAGDELVALEIRETLAHLGRILGTVYTDDVLDRVFSRFCIGK